MTNRLSHSSVTKYGECPYKYKLHYVDRLRGKYTSAALLFGSALDVALSQMLADHAENNLDHLGQSYEAAFNNNWLRAKINDKIVELMESEEVVYAATDFDHKLLTDKDWLLAMTKLQNNFAAAGKLPSPDKDGVMAIYKAVLEHKQDKGFDNLLPEERKFYNFMNWLSLYKKAQLMLKAYREQIIPRIKKVLAIQRQVDLEGEAGDSIVGFIDFICEWEDGSIVVFDNKTSAREYAYDAVSKSPQLTLYVHAVENEFKTRKAGFIVMKKAIKKNTSKKCQTCKFDGEDSRAKTCTKETKGKRCGGTWTEVIKPEADIQVLVGSIPEQLETVVMENFVEVNAAITAKSFPRNLNACESNYGPCVYYSLCHRNSTKDLVNLNEVNEKEEIPE